MTNVLILMGTYNGEKFLLEQLESFSHQTHKEWRLAVSDDGSTDRTLDILDTYQKKWGQEKLVVFRGDGKGFCHNYITLTARPELESEYYAWSDQDDVWLPDKLSRALAKLAPYGGDAPALYCSRSIFSDSQNHPYGLSYLRNEQQISFSNALSQSLAGANTMIFNHSARELIVMGRDYELVSHDWWSYLVVSGCGGVVLYDPEPSLFYRQHSGNMVGQNSSWLAQVKRLKKALTGTIKKFNDLNTKALIGVSNHLTTENRNILENFIAIRNCGNIFKRVVQLRSSGINRQRFIERFFFYVAAALKQF